MMQHFLETLINKFSSEGDIDNEKVFCTGMSNGGDFCYLLACEASESFLGVAPVSGMIMEDILESCNPSQTLGILEIHGTNDEITYYDGCLLYTSPSPRDTEVSRMPSSA